MTDNVIPLGAGDGRKEVWRFPDGTVVTMEVPISEPPITVKHAIYCCSSIVHQLHTAVLP
jgi:hypothetical protein